MSRLLNGREVSGEDRTESTTTDLWPGPSVGWFPTPSSTGFQVPVRLVQIQSRPEVASWRGRTTSTRPVSDRMRGRCPWSLTSRERVGNVTLHSVWVSSFDGGIESKHGRRNPGPPVPRLGGERSRTGNLRTTGQTFFRYPSSPFSI